MFDRFGEFVNTLSDDPVDGLEEAWFGSVRVGSGRAAELPLELGSSKAERLPNESSVAATAISKPCLPRSMSLSISEFQVIMLSRR